MRDGFYIVAIGQTAVGLIAIGQLAIGLVSIGQLGAGLLFSAVSNISMRPLHTWSSTRGFSRRASYGIAFLTNHLLIRLNHVAGISGCMHRCHLWAYRHGHALPEVGNVAPPPRSFRVIWGILTVGVSALSRCLMGLTLLKDDRSEGVLHVAIFDMTNSAVSYGER